MQNYRHRTETNSSRGKDWPQQQPEKWIEHASGDRHAQRVVQKSKEQILADVAHSRPAEFAGAHNSGKISFYQRDAATFHRDVRAGPHGDAHVGLSQGRRIVDSIARHRDRAAFFLQPLHDSRFLLGKNFSFELVDSQLPSNVFGSCVAVAREHQQSQPFAFQITNRLWRGWLNWVSNAEQSGNPPIY